MIVSAEPFSSDVCKIVVQLGGFHTEMSFRGAIGHIMNDSGLQEVLTTVYAENAVSQMLNGKAVARALRWHGLVHMTLQQLIVSEVSNLDRTGRDLTETEGKGDNGQESCIEYVAQRTRHSILLPSLTVMVILPQYTV